MHGNIPAPIRSGGLSTTMAVKEPKHGYSVRSTSDENQRDPHEAQCFSAKRRHAEEIPFGTVIALFVDSVSYHHL